MWAPVACTGEWLGDSFGKRYGSREAIQVLDRVVQSRFPTTCLAPGTKLRVDNGPCCRADASMAHTEALGFQVEHIQVQTPEENGIVESFHAGLERDHLRHQDFDSLSEAEKANPPPLRII